VAPISWSPDGSTIYFDRAIDVPDGIFSVPVLGGEERLIVENATKPEALPDGSLLVFRANHRSMSNFYVSGRKLAERTSIPSRSRTPSFK
jgi:eukaryotic-like serine/threonine-protein kinase